MVGQLELKGRIIEQIKNNTFPRFSILVGPSGSGKKMMSKVIADNLHMQMYVCGIDVASIRNMILDANKITTPIVYVIPDADKMSIAAKNALLKVTEEPPQNAYFIMTLQNAENTLGTIRSRGVIYHMNNYTYKEITDYVLETTHYTATDAEVEIATSICESPGDVNMLFRDKSNGYAEEFYNYACKVVSNIDRVSGSNSFKIGDKIAFRDTDKDKYDLRLFWKAFISICMDELYNNVYKYTQAIKITSKYLQELRIVGINKRATFDIWLLSIRREWMQ